ncbi:MAG: hypothetical protein HY901_15455 [Deltaproteobacteria bacterium]|nr:hypothetical protein [Deltaproteobacteria bacterium]
MAKTATPTVYNHADHSDWGPGLILEENSAKLYLHFVDGGRRVFQNIPKFRERLVPAGLTADAAAEVIAVIEKGNAKLAAKKVSAAKKSKKVSKVAAAAAAPVEVAEAEQPEVDSDDGDQDGAADE